MVRGQIEAQDKPVDKLNVKELWSEVARLKINASLNLKKASLAKLVREARSKETATAGTTSTTSPVQTRGKKRKEVAFDEEIVDDETPAPKEAKATFPENDNRINNLESTVIELASAVKALSEQLSTPPRNGLTHAGLQQDAATPAARNGLAQQPNGAEVPRRPGTMMDPYSQYSHLSRDGLDRGPMPGLVQNPATPPSNGRWTQYREFARVRL